MASDEEVDESYAGKLFVWLVGTARSKPTSGTTNSFMRLCLIWILIITNVNKNLSVDDRSDLFERFRWGFDVF